MFTRILVKTDNSTILCVFLCSCDAKEYSRTVRRTFCVCMLQCLHSENRTKLSSLLRRQIDPYVCSSLTPTYWHFLTFYVPCSKFIIAYVPPVLKLSFILNESLPKSSLPNIFVSFLFTDENVNKFSHNFCHSKRVFVRYRQWKKMSLTKMISQRN